MPKISVVMPAYNAEKYIAEAIESILSQTFRDFEFIIINDGSTDKTKEIILSFGDTRIVYLENEKNLGIVETLNRGLDAARGEYIARMDADDVAMPERFEKQLAYMEKHPEVGVLGCGVYLYDGKENYGERRFSEQPYAVAVDLLFSCALAHPTVMIRKNVLASSGVQYEAQYHGCEDYRMWTRLVPVTGIANLPEPLLRYRKHRGQITAKKSGKTDSLVDNIRLDYFAALGICLEEDEAQVLRRFSTGGRKFGKDELDLLRGVMEKAHGRLSERFGSRRKIKGLLSAAFFSCENTHLKDHGGLVTWRIILSRLLH